MTDTTQRLVVVAYELTIGAAALVASAMGHISAIPAGLTVGVMIVAAVATFPRGRRPAR